MKAEEFDNQVKQLRAACKEKNQAPQRLAQLLLERLQAEGYTYDGTVLEVVYAWRGYESETSAQPAAPFVQTNALIDAVLEFADYKPMLRAVLYLIRAELAHEQGHLQPAAEAFAEAVDELHALHLDIDHKRIYAMLHFGLTLLAQGNKRDAEKLFLDVLSYPWFLVMESDVQALLRDYYVKAALGLIECRRGDLAALEEIFFVPATHDELLPYLQRAIEEAGGRLNR